MTDDLQALEEWAGALLAKMQPAQRRKLTHAVAIDLRRSQQQRISEQRNPDGNPYSPRKPGKNLRAKTGRVKGKMFTKIKLGRNLKLQSDDNSAIVAFSGRVGRIARVHHFGLRDKVGPNGPWVRYPERRLLGYSTVIQERIQQIVLDHLQARQH